MGRLAGLCGLVLSFSAAAADSDCPRGAFGVSDLGIGKKIRKLIINVGSNKDPLPPSKDDETEATLAVEPVHTTLNKIQVKEHQGRLLALAAAVSEGPPRIGAMHLMVKQSDQESASLSDPVVTSDSGWRQPTVILPLCAILEAVPAHVNITILKTDMQGHDCAALRSAGSSIRKAPIVFSEVFVSNLNSYHDVKNDFRHDCNPFMEAHGFRLGPRSQALLSQQRHEKSEARPGKGEANVVWFRGTKIRSSDAQIENKLLWQEGHNMQRFRTTPAPGSNTGLVPHLWTADEKKAYNAEQALKRSKRRSSRSRPRDRDP